MHRNRLTTSVTSFLLFFLAWEAFCWLTGVQEMVLPRPSQVLTTLVYRFPSILPHLAQTLVTTTMGFLIGVTLGGLAGLSLGWSRLAYSLISPVLAGLYSIPKAAFVPIFVLWFGAGTVPAVLAAMIGAVLPVAVNVANGISTVEPDLEEVLTSLRAGRLDVIRYLAIPSALPSFLASLKIAFSLALVGSVVSEIAASNRGLGNVMMIAIASYDTPLAFAALVLLGAIGSLAFGLISLAERHIAFWAHRSQILSLG